MRIINLIKITQCLKNVFQNGRHFHATIALKGGNIIAIGHNDYRKEHPNYHREFMCKGCELEGVSCDFYDENTINCHFWRSKDENNDF